MITHTWETLCQDKINCTICRTKEGYGRRFREHVAPRIGSGMVVDFECPSGHSWDEIIKPERVIPVVPIPELVQKSDETVPRKIDTELSKQRYEICKVCEHVTENGFGCKLHKGCCFGGWRGKPENKCYANPPRWDAVTK